MCSLFFFFSFLFWMNNYSNKSFVHFVVAFIHIFLLQNLTEDNREICFILYYSLFLFHLFECHKIKRYIFILGSISNIRTFKFLKFNELTGKCFQLNMRKVVKRWVGITTKKKSFHCWTTEAFEIFYECGETM